MQYATMLHIAYFSY